MHYVTLWRLGKIFFWFVFPAELLLHQSSVLFFKNKGNSFGDLSDNPWQKHFFQQHVHINYFHFHFMLNRMPHRSWLVMLHCLHERCQMNDCVSSSRTVAKSKGIFPGILYHVLLPSSPLSRLHLRLPPRSYHHPLPGTVLVFLWIPCIWSFLGNAHGRAVEWTTGNKASWFPQQLEEVVTLGVGSGSRVGRFWTF